jgi:hypothetical protein
MAGNPATLLAQAEKKLKGWGLFGNKYEDALELYEQVRASEGEGNGHGRDVKAMRRSCLLLVMTLPRHDPHTIITFSSSPRTTRRPRSSPCAFTSPPLRGTRTIP